MECAPNAHKTFTSTPREFAAKSSPSAGCLIGRQEFVRAAIRATKLSMAHASFPTFPLLKIRAAENGSMGSAQSVQ